MPEMNKPWIEVSKDELVPSEHAKYFEDFEKKHFVPEFAIGSLFTEVKNLQELLDLAKKQRGSLDGDDRQKFVELGVPEAALLPFCRYLMVETAGEVGIIKAKDLPLDTKVKVVRTKVGAPCSLVVEASELPLTNIGTIVIGPNEKDEKDPNAYQPTTESMVWTAHPGLPIRPASGDTWTEGAEVTIAEVIEKSGTEAYLNVKKVEKQ